MSALRFRYQTLEFGDLDIHLRTLRDRQQYHDPDGQAEDMGISSASWPLFGVLWPSAEILAQLMMDYDISGRRILEVGCGIGLASLLLNQRDANITATDQHPIAEEFMQLNTGLNNARDIPFVRTGWNDAENDLEKYDLIIGSDILYEPNHAELLARFIHRHANPVCEVIIIDPGRGHGANFSKQMTGFGYSHSQEKAGDRLVLSQPYKGNIHNYKREPVIGL